MWTHGQSDSLIHSKHIIFFCLFSVGITVSGYHSDRIIKLNVDNSNPAESCIRNKQQPQQRTKQLTEKKDNNDVVDDDDEKKNFQEFL